MSSRASWVLCPEDGQAHLLAVQGPGFLTTQCGDLAAVRGAPVRPIAESSSVLRLRRGVPASRFPSRPGRPQDPGCPLVERHGSWRAAVTSHTTAVNGRARPAYDPWRDADRIPITVGCHVKQIAIAREFGALAARLNKHGVVISLGGLNGRGFRLRVRFDGETEPATIRPHLVRVVQQ